MSGLRTIWAFLLKDIEDATRSFAIFFLLIGPVLLSVFFTRFFTGGDIRHPVIFVCDEGKSAFVQALRTTDLFQIQENSDWQYCLESVRLGRACGAVHLSRNFDESIDNDEFPELPLAVNEASLAQSAIFREGVRSALRSLAGQELPADVRVERINKRSGENRLSILPIWLVFTSLGGLILASSSLVEELDRKTLDAVLMTPARLVYVLIGKTLAGAVIALIASLLVLFLNSDGAGNNLSLAVILIAGALLFALGGTVFGLFARTQTVANAVAPMLYMVLFVPLALADISEKMRIFSQYLPTWYIYDGISKSLLSDWSLTELRVHMICLMVCIIMLLIVGMLKLRSDRA